MRKTSIASILPLLMLGNSKKDLTQISILISKYGRVKYHTAAGEKLKVMAGAVIRNDGKLKLSADASAVVFTNGKYVRLDEAGEHELSGLASGGGMQKLNFDARFNRYLLAAVALVANAEDGDAWGELSGKAKAGDAWGELSSSSKAGDAWGELSGNAKAGDAWGELSGKKKTGDAWGELSGKKKAGDAWGELSGKKKTGDAWGDDEGRIVPILPFGKVPVEPLIFQWSQPQISQAYTLEVLDESGGIVYSGEVKDNWTQVNMKTLPLRPGTTYSWRINVPEHPEKTSTKVSIVITEEDVEQLLESKLKKSDAYQLQDPVLSSLMEAVVLEEAERFYEAHQRYEMLHQSFKKNNLVKMMQATFYLRHQLRPRAEQLFWKKGSARELES